MDYENILKLYDSEDEAVLIDSSNNNQRETIFLKFLHPESTSKSTFCVELINKITSLNIESVGMYFKGPRGVLYEVVWNNFLKDWFIQLFEERNSGPLNASARKNILKLCYGKFKIIINNSIVYLIVIPDIKCENIPCQSSIPQIGPCNLNFVNITAERLNDTNNEIIMKFLNARHSGSLPALSGLIGLRVENAHNSYNNVRFLFTCKDFSDDVLKLLNEEYGRVSFSPFTVHAIPKLLSEALSAAITSGRSVSSLLPIVLKNDIITCINNELKIIHKGNNHSESNRTPVSSSLSHNPSIKNNAESQNHPVHQARPQIFDRLGSRVDSSNNQATSESQPIRDNIKIIVRAKKSRDKNSGRKLKSIIVRPASKPKF